MRNHIILALFIFAVLVSACKYKKGEIVTSTFQGDSLKYVILAGGKGEKLSKKAAELKLRHEYKGNICVVKYISDSAMLIDQKGVLLFNSSLPDIKNDILTKGFLGTLTSKQNVIYLLVSSRDFDRYFRKTER